jgi:DNA-binding HxlR family transcriptional regulator
MEHLEKLCPKFEEAFTLLGKRWTGLIIRSLFSGPKRFREMAEMIPNMSDRMLAERCRELEQEEILIRQVYPETPVRIEYQLTEKGKGLKKGMDAIQEWADLWIQPKQQ